MRVASLKKWLTVLISVPTFFALRPGCIYCAQAGPTSTTVYVASGDSSSISVIRSLDDRVIATVDVGGKPLALAVTPDGAKAYVGVDNRGVVLILRSENKITTTIKAGDHPATLAVTPDGSKALVVASMNNALLQGVVSIIQTSHDTVVSSCPIDLICWA